MTRQNTGKTVINDELYNKTKNEKMKNSNSNNEEKLDKIYKDDFDPYSIESNINFKGLEHCEVNVLFERLMETSNKLLRKGGYMVCLYPYEIAEDEME